MANAADYLTFSTQQVVANYKLRDRAVSSREVTVTNVSTVFRITVLVEDTFDGSALTPNQLILEPLESKTFTISYDLDVMETLPVGIIPATINFTATAEPIIIVPPAPPPPLPLPPPPISVVYRGCTDSTAFNYNKLATVDDGSCIAKVYGCTNSNALNYNPLANIDNGCEFPPIQQIDSVLGCTNRTAFNYNPQATQDDGSCVQIIPGCQDSTALNYNPNANTPAECKYALPVEGCTDKTAFNYNPVATISKNEICSYVIVDELIDCMDPKAKNYNPRATRAAVPDNCLPFPVLGCMSTGACNYNSSATEDDGSCVFPTRLGNCGTVFGCTNISAINYNKNADEDDGSCQFVLDQVLGCKDPKAINYFRLATVDDGSCIFTKPCCTNISAANYDPTCTSDDGSCKFVGCKNPAAINYNSFESTIACANDVCCDFGCNSVACKTIGFIASIGAADSRGFANVCRYVQGYTQDGTCKSGCVLECTDEFVGKLDIYGCTDPRMANYNPDATKDDGSCLPVKGCTSKTAINYNSRAMEDDGSCVEAVVGCMDPKAKNYDPTATINDIACIYDTVGCTDFAALNYNPAATINDGTCKYYTSGGGGGGNTDLQNTLLTNNIGGGTVEPGGVVTQYQI